MVKVRIQYDPINYGTEIAINGKYISKESRLYKIIEGKPIQEYLNIVTQLLINEWGKVEVDLVFSTLPEDQKELEMLFKRMKHVGKVQKLQLQTSQVKNKEVSITVIATMSSGKSTLINALLGQKLMPSSNQSCTAKMTEILDSDKEIFTAKAYDESHQVIEEVSDLTYEIMVRLNEDPSVHRIAVEGKVPFLDAQGTALMLVDTPGLNNSYRNYDEAFERIIENSENNLMIYVLNGTQFEISDETSLLRRIAKQMRKEGQKSRDRFLFVVNKMDAFYPEEESIERVVENAKKC